jgi:transposase
MIDALEQQRGPIDEELRAYARRQIGCRALIAAHYGIGPLTSAAILAELGRRGRLRRRGRQSPDAAHRGDR